MTAQFKSVLIHLKVKEEPEGLTHASVLHGYGNGERLYFHKSFFILFLVEVAEIDLHCPVEGTQRFIIQIKSKYNACSILKYTKDFKQKVVYSTTVGTAFSAL